ncbi:MAG TPA: thiamine pyrophosphate-dependent enzyme, partial [Candidatus Acidoferrum sp.]|nr:thiamine pyrophosphate-dependent enzyme [Candidatus Acidoferrum sp.]
MTEDQTATAPPRVDAPATDGATERALQRGAEPGADPTLSADGEKPAAEIEASAAEVAVGAAEANDAPDADDTAADADDTAAEPEDVASEAEGGAAPPAKAVREPRTAGRFVADALHAAGARVAFTVPGESFLGLLDALGDAGIRVVAARHEGGAAFMAEAYGQLTGRPGLCIATRAVGGTNLGIGIHTARADSTAMFAVVGQVARGLRGREAFQEVDLVQSIGRLAVHADEINDTARLPAALAEATRMALGGRPGPVVLSLPEDLLDETMPLDADVLAVQRRRPAEPDTDVVRSILRRLTAAERPVILAGAGVLRSRSTSDLVRLAEIVEVPVIASWRRGDVFPNEHPLYLGMAGLGAPTTVRDRLAEADEILVVGSRLNEATSGEYRVPAEGQRWTHVDLEPRSGGSGLPSPTVSLTADARTFLRLAARVLAGAVHDKDRLDQRRTANEADRAAFEAARVVDTGEWQGPGVHPGRIVATLDRVLPAQAVLTTDAGNFAGWLARGFSFRRPGTFLGPTSGAMGYGIPAAIAAKAVHPDRFVVCVSGDGDFLMSGHEVATAVQEGLPIVVLVVNNGMYGTIRMHQEREFPGRVVATEIKQPDFAMI